jgi:hypothetical protein
MTPVSFPECNVAYRPPHNWTNEFPGEVPAKRDEETCTSRWVLSKDELGALNMGGFIELTVVGGQPAVKLEVV